MHKPESVIKRIMDRVISDFDIKMDTLIPDRKPDQAVINKKNELAT